MKRVTAEDFRANAGRYLQDAEAGETVLVVEGDREVARLSPANGHGPDDDRVMRPKKNWKDLDLDNLPRPRLRRPVDIDALLAEMREDKL